MFDEHGNPVMQQKVRKIRNRKTGEVREKEVSVTVTVNTRFEAGEVTEDGPLAPLIGMAKGQKQFLMERGLWVAGMKAKCGATAKNHHGNCCAKGLMYQQDDFQVSV